MFRSETVVGKYGDHPSRSHYMANQLPVRPRATHDVSAAVQVKDDLVLPSILRPEPVDINTGDLGLFNLYTLGANQETTGDFLKLRTRLFDRQVGDIEALYILARQPTNEFCAATHCHGVTVTDN